MKPTPDPIHPVDALRQIAEQIIPEALRAPDWDIAFEQMRNHCDALVGQFKAF